MLGAIIGDIVGSRFEWNNHKSKDFDLFTPQSKFTDDTVLTIAIADAIINGKDYADAVMEWGCRYPTAGYGANFIKWLDGIIVGPYNSWGNGSAMRVSPVGFLYHTERTILREAKKSAEITHNHPEGIKGAEAIALSIYMARKKYSKTDIKETITDRFGYDLNRTLVNIRPTYQFDVSCQGSVPEAIIAFLESVDYEDAIRNAISIGGDSDTIACITGGIAEAFYGDIPDEIIDSAMTCLTDEMRSILKPVN